MKHVVFAFSMLFAVAAIQNVSAADKADKNAKVAKDKEDGKTLHGVFVRDGENLSLRVGKDIYIAKPSAKAADDVKKQLNVANVDALLKAHWAVTGSVDATDVNKKIILIDSMNKEEKPKK